MKKILKCHFRLLVDCSTNFYRFLKEKRKKFKLINEKLNLWLVQDIFTYFKSSYNFRELFMGFYFDTTT